ncbi:MAG TPA: hypothetical protein VLA52_06405 [Thermohalobaculum sp.]|nr:hypothetical protein [Thermohalobaculum sp.]
MSKLTPEQVLRSHFGPVAGLPCWQVAQGYGSFITMEFGEPRLEIRQPAPESKIRALQRRGVTVRGSRHMWIEQCGWKIMEGLGEVANSETPREDIARALALIDGQVLREIRLNPDEGSCVLGFEHRMFLMLRRYDDWQQGDQMLSVYGPEAVLTYCAGGQLEYGPGDDRNRTSLRSGKIRMMLEPE